MVHTEATSHLTKLKMILKSFLKSYENVISYKFPGNYSREMNVVGAIERSAKVDTHTNRKCFSMRTSYLGFLNRALKSERDIVVWSAAWSL